MRVTATLEGLKEAQQSLKGFSDRRLAATMATALTRTAVEVKAGVQKQLPSIFDRPTPYTINSLFVAPATAQKLEAEVGFKDSTTVSGRIPASRYLLPEVKGGPRRNKAFEKALQRGRYLPSGMYAVPAGGALLDSHGNVQRKQLGEILSQLRAGTKVKPLAAGRKGIAAQRKAGGRYFVMLGKSKKPVGIFLRELIGRDVTPVFVFTRPPQYRARFDFEGIATSIAMPSLVRNIDRAFGESLARLRARTS